MSQQGPVDKEATAEQEALDIHAPQSFEAYNEYSKTLRTWLVAYGIGGPILFVSQQQIADKLAASPAKTLVIYLFLAGLAAQILISLLNKWVNWAAYEMGLNPPPALKAPQKAVIWLSKQFWIDILCDLVSVVSFMVATFWVLRVILA